MSGQYLHRLGMHASLRQYRDEPVPQRVKVELPAVLIEVRDGYGRITAMLRLEGWKVNHKRIERLWRQEGLKVPVMQPKRNRLWLK